MPGKRRHGNKKWMISQKNIGHLEKIWNNAQKNSFFSLEKQIDRLTSLSLYWNM